MKAKYKHHGNDCIIYNQVICEDNIVVEIESYTGYWNSTPKTNIIICDNHKKAFNLYLDLCRKLERNNYDCEYRD